MLQFEMPVAEALVLTEQFRVDEPWYRLVIKRKYGGATGILIRTQNGGLLCFPPRITHEHFGSEPIIRERLVIERTPDAGIYLSFRFEGEFVPAEQITSDRIEFLEDEFCVGSKLELALWVERRHGAPQFPPSFR